MEDKPNKSTNNTPNASAPKAPANAPKGAPPKLAGKKTPVPTAPPKVPGKPATAQNNASATSNLSAEQAKQAEIQSAMKGKGTSNKKKRTTRKVLFTLIIVILIAGIAVGSALLLPTLLGKNNQEIKIDIGEDMFGVSETKFSDPVEDYQPGDKIERGLSVRNNGTNKVFLCFKMEIYDKDEDETGQPIPGMNVQPDLDTRLWLKGEEVNEIVNNGSSPIKCVYYYSKNVIDKKDGARNLFSEYKVDVESSVASEYANKTVTCKVTIRYMIADASKINSQTDECWNKAPETWKIDMRKQTTK